MKTLIGTLTLLALLGCNDGKTKAADEQLAMLTQALQRAASTAERNDQLLRVECVVLADSE